MVLPVKLQANILSWMKEESTPSLEYAPPRVPDDTTAGAETRSSTECEWNTCFSPTELFLLSNAAAAAGAPCVVIKDRFIEKEQASRVYEGERYTLFVEETANVGLICLYATTIDAAVSVAFVCTAFDPADFFILLLSTITITTTRVHFVL